MYPPPWIHTITGRPAAPGSGVHTLRLRQSSPTTSGLKYLVRSGLGSSVGCGQPAPDVVASRTPDHGAGGCGGRNRLAPNGGAAYGMPLNAVTPFALSARTRPS